MSNDVAMNDTFDNFSFSNILTEPIEAQPQTEINENSAKDANDWFSTSSCNASFDDSIFFKTTFQTCLETPQSSQPTPEPPNPTQNHSETSKIADPAPSTPPKASSLANWGLPAAILAKYRSKNITEMFPWQVECLSLPALAASSNLVYSAPTSAGKTLVAELLALKTVLERSKKAIFILPFISVVREKMFHLQEVLAGAGVRVDGFMGAYAPPGGFDPVHVAVCTIEKANSLVNRLLADRKMHEVGAVVVDELHLLADPSRGFLLELLLAKIRYTTLTQPDVRIQIVGMSATLPNLPALAAWLDAALYVTDFRPIPLYERALVANRLTDRHLATIRTLQPLENDVDNILQLCVETLLESCGVLIFCPTKNWCENLALQLARAFWALGRRAHPVRAQIEAGGAGAVLERLRLSPSGLDATLKQCVSFGVAFHHAGLTMDERDIIEGGFRGGALRVLVATSTLSSGVNLPAKRVIVRTPMVYGGRALDAMTYRQMIGRAGRMGRDSSGESVLVLQEKDVRIGGELMARELEPIGSCLEEGRLKRAVLEVVASGAAGCRADVEKFVGCTLWGACRGEGTEGGAKEAVDFLIENEFIKVQKGQDRPEEELLAATSLGKACLSSSLPPEDGLALFAELGKARECFVLETELHLVYLVTPYSACNQWPNIDWMYYLDLWAKLPKSMKKVGELVGVREGFIVQATRGVVMGGAKTNPAMNHKLLVHKRFYIALALQDLVNERPLIEVCEKYACPRGLLQSLQLSASTFAGMVAAFSRELGWSSVELLIAQFQERLHFGVNRDLLDLMRLPLLTSKSARALHNAAIETLADLAKAPIPQIETILARVQPFESGKPKPNEPTWANSERKRLKCVWIMGKEGLSEAEAAALLVRGARAFLLEEMGVKEALWGERSEDRGDVSQDSDLVNDSRDGLDCCMSLSELTLKSGLKRRLEESAAPGTPEKRSKLSVDLFSKQRFEEFHVVNVCDRSELIESFKVELMGQDCVALALFVEKGVEKRMKIGLRNDGGDDEGRGLERVLGFSVCWGGDVVYYFCMRKEERIGRDVLGMLGGKRVIMYDWKRNVKVLMGIGGFFRAKLEDPKVGDWILNPNGDEKNLKGLVLKHCQFLAKFISTDEKEQKSPKIDSCTESLLTWHLTDSIKQKLEAENPNFTTVYENEMSIVPIVAKMELNGLGINTKKLVHIFETLTEIRKNIEKSAHSLAGRRFSFSSRKEIARILGLATTTSNKKALANSKSPISDLVFEWRRISGILASMIRPLLQINGRIHGSHLLHTLTGRITMHEPNLQMMAKDFDIFDPIRCESVKISCRDMFEAGKGCALISADYCQLELRLLAHLSQDLTLCGAMRGKGDVFRAIGAKWAKVEENQVDDQQRQKVKGICYGIIYGMGAKSLSEQMKITETEASTLMSTFKATYPGLDIFIHQTLKECQKHGYVETILGRRRPLPNINSDNKSDKSQAERQAVNTRVQGSAADLVKRCMIEMEEKSDKFGAKMVLHLHDELIYEIEEPKAFKFGRILKETMENSVRLSIPFPVKVKKGSTWGQLAEINL